MFNSPLIAITLISDADDLVLLKDVEERAIGERRFLVGQGVDDQQVADWRNGKRVWIAVEDVQQIVEFESVEDFNKSLDIRKGEDAHAASLSRGPRMPVSRR